MDRGNRYFMLVSKHRMVHQYLPKWKACISSLTNEQIWLAEPGMNSIGDITLHVMEHVRRNALRLEEPGRQFGGGIERYFPDYGSDGTELLERLENPFSELRAAMERSADHPPDLYDIYHLVEHAGYHLGQIVDRARRMTGIDYNFVGNGIHERALKQSIEAEIAGLNGE